ncbi:hypothetical protein V3F56_03515 [Moorellaceae bacterium AZ2]
MIDYTKILVAALKDLMAAAEKLTADTVPGTPLPRPRKFIFVQQGKKMVAWPVWIKGELYWNFFEIPNTEFGSVKDAVRSILFLTQEKPRLVLRALRRIQAATAWCEARAEGRKRQAQEILRQQSKAVEALEAEAVLLALKGASS